MWLINWVATVVGVALCVLLMVALVVLGLATGVIVLLRLLVTSALSYAFAGALMLIRKPDSWNESLRRAGY